MGQSVNVTVQFLASFSIAQSFMTLMCHLQVIKPPSAPSSPLSLAILETVPCALIRAQQLPLECDRSDFIVMQGWAVLMRPDRIASCYSNMSFKLAVDHKRSEWRTSQFLKAECHPKSLRDALCCDQFSCGCSGGRFCSLRDAWRS